MKRDRPPVTTDRAVAAAETLERVASGTDEIIGDHAWATRLAAAKLGELLDETGGLARAAASDPELDRILRHEVELEAARWTDPR